MLVRFFTHDAYHNRGTSGSTKIRAHNLIKYWENSGLYKYGEKPDVFIFQKVYCTYDYKLPATYKGGIKILDVCDPDWTQSPDIYIKETLDGVDGIVVPTEALKELIETMTKTPVRVIKDRFDLDEFPEPKKHTKRADSLVWFGYSQNTQLLKFAIPSLESRNLGITVISNEDPMAYMWANDSNAYQSKYTYIKFEQDTLYENLQAHDLCIFPKGFRPEDKYKSENKTVIAQLCGIPVVSDSDQLDQLIDPEARNAYIDNVYKDLRKEYDAQKSVEEYKRFIDEIKATRRSN